MPTTLSKLDNNLLFLGSRLGNSLLLKYEVKIKSAADKLITPTPEIEANETTTTSPTTDQVEAPLWADGEVRKGIEYEKSNEMYPVLRTFFVFI